MLTPSTATAHIDETSEHEKETAFELDSLPRPVTAAAATAAGSKGGARAVVVREGRAQALRVHWARFKQRINPSLSMSNTSEIDGSHVLGDGATNDNHATAAAAAGPVDAVVVDRSWFHSPDASCSHSQSDADPKGLPRPGSVPHGTTPSAATEPDSFSTGFWTSNAFTTFLRYRLWSAVLEVFAPHFSNPEAEKVYAKEHWVMNKALYLWSTCFLTLHALLTAATLTKPSSLPDQIFYYGAGPAVVLLVPIMIMYDWPRHRPFIYQFTVTVAVWMWTTYTFIYIWGCGFYTKNLDPRPYHVFLSCGSKDFIATFLFATALPTIALFGMGQKRLSALIGVLFAFTLGCVLILRWRLPWYRNLIQTLVYHLFLIYLHYARENAERKMHQMRDILKIQHKATQQAQVNERETSDSKRRLTSYIFHEVRVPLNSALLAVQNMAAEGVFRKSHELEFTALEGSLSMMSQVLNDMLDFNRLDAGKFESMSRPFSFHQVLHSLVAPLRLATDARQLSLIVELDPLIDQFARRATGEDESAIEERPNDPGIVIGDEHRLRQIITNLSSNACKFSPPGGAVTVRTKLLWPTGKDFTGPTPVSVSTGNQKGKPHRSHHHQAHHHASSATRNSTTPSKSGSDRKLPGTVNGHANLTPMTGHQQPPLSADALDSHNAFHEGRPPLDRLVVRIEVHDTGVGIQAKDIAQHKLFTPFNQTDVGRLQGGKGTGLGLALVHQIVKRSGGRLGVYSEGLNRGSTFWVELMLVVGPDALVGTADAADGLTAEYARPAGLDRPTFQFTSGPPSIGRERRTASRDELRAEVIGARTEASAAGLSQSVAGSLVADQGSLLVSRHSGAADDSHPVLSRITSNAASPAASDERTSFIEHIPVMNIPDGIVTSPSADLLSSSGGNPASAANPVSVVPMLRLGLGDLRPQGAVVQASATQHPPGLARRAISDPLPVAPDGAAAAAQSPQQQQQTWPPGMPVLVVDDDSITRKLMARLLQRLGCHVTTAPNGQVALDLIMDLSPRSEGENTLESADALTTGAASGTAQAWWTDRERYAVCLLDNMMPVLSGVEAAGKLRAAGRKDFVVGVTGNALLSDQQEYIEAGADFVLTKPVLEKSLRQVLVLAEERRRRRMHELQPSSEEGEPSTLSSTPASRHSGSAAS